MKKSVVLFVALCGVIACAIIYLSKHNSAPAASPPAAETTPPPAEPAGPEKTVAAKQESPAPVSAGVSEPAKVSVTTPVAGEMKPEEADGPIRKAVDALLSAKSAAEKHNVFQQLLKDGQLDAAMAELKRRMTEQPDNAELPITLGEAQLNKAGAIKEAGGDINEMGILAMQADQSFNAALKIDPQNWEANFMKASAMYHWPADLARDNDVVQRLSGLIDRQEAGPSRPEYAKTYVVLGNEYQKIGQPEKAVATWQLGLVRFPGNPVLLKKLAGQP